MFDQWNDAAAAVVDGGDGGGGGGDVAVGRYDLVLPRGEEAACVSRR